MTPENLATTSSRVNSKLSIFAFFEKVDLRKSTLAPLAIVWGLFAVTELALQAFISRSAFHSFDVPVGARLLLFCRSLIDLTLFLLLLAALFRLILSINKRFVPSWLGLRRLVTIVVFVSLWLALILYGASWGLFWQTGSFIDSQVLIFMAPHPLQVFHWVDVDVAVIIVTAAAIFALAISIWIPRWAIRQSHAVQKKLIMTWGWLVGIATVGAFLGSLYSSWGDRQFTRAGILYSRTQDNRSGPFTYVLTDFAKYLNHTHEDLSINKQFEIVERPILPLDQYKALAASSKHHLWNVIILTVESLRADQLRAYAANRDVMPAVNALAKEGRAFLNTYTQSSHTNYATIVPLSSHYPLRSATAYTYPVNPSYPRVLIYDLLKSIGYRTALFSSSNENWGGMINYLNTGSLDRFIHAANSKRPTYLMQTDTGFAIWAWESQNAGSVDDRFTVDEAIEWIDGLNDGPFFLAMNFQNSHLPYPVPPDFPRRFGSAKLDFTIRFAHFPKDKAQIVKDVYADSLAYVDLQIGRLFQHLKEKNKWGNTVIVVTGDHGQAFYEHGFASHASAVFDEVMKVPLVIRAPGLQVGLDHRLAQHVDIAPSVIGLLGLPPHPSFQGIDLFHTTPDPRRSVYMVAQTPDAYQYGIVRSGYKLIYDERERENLLFDLNEDPGESKNIAEVQPALVIELANRLNAWRKLQIGYYSDARLQARVYPPILKD